MGGFCIPVRGVVSYPQTEIDANLHINVEDVLALQHLKSNTAGLIQRVPGYDRINHLQLHGHARGLSSIVLCKSVLQRASLVRARTRRCQQAKLSPMISLGSVLK